MILLFLVSENSELFAGGPIPVNALYAAVIAVVFCALVFTIFNWRGPSCNTYLGKGINPKYCSRCGIELR